MNEEDFAKLPEASAEDHTLIWSMGDMNDTLIVEEWTGAAMVVQLSTAAGSTDMTCVMIQTKGIKAGERATLNAQTKLAFPLELMREIGPWMVDQVAKIDRNEKARVIANNEPPKEPR